MKNIKKKQNYEQLSLFENGETEQNLLIKRQWMWKKKKRCNRRFCVEPVFRKGLQPGAGTVRLAGTKPENNFVGGDF